MDCYQVLCKVINILLSRVVFLVWHGSLKYTINFPFLLWFSNLQKIFYTNTEESNFSIVDDSIRVA